jgi:Fur family transcriptional regulator, peroxide stress response regulator
MTGSDEILLKLSACGLKITPQRVAVLQALEQLQNHPRADQLIEMVKENHPNIAVGTIYSTLDTFLKKGLIKKVNTDSDITRYEMHTEPHHHVFYMETEQIEDFRDEKLDKIIEKYFKENPIPGIDIKSIQIQISGNSKEKTSPKNK